MNVKKLQKKVKLYRRKDSSGKTESIIVEVNTKGLIEKRHFTDEKTAYEYIETLKKGNRLS